MTRPAVVALAADILDELLQEEDLSKPASILRTWVRLVPGATRAELRQAVRVVQNRGDMPMEQAEQSIATLH